MADKSDGPVIVVRKKQGGQPEPKEKKPQPKPSDDSDEGEGGIVIIKRPPKNTGGRKDSVPSDDEGRRPSVPSDDEGRRDSVQSDDDVQKSTEQTKAPPPTRGRGRPGGARMLHPGNGREGFETLQPTSGLGKIKVTKAVVKAMLRRETQLRFSTSVQIAYAKSNQSTSVTDELQRQVAEEFGFEDPAVGVDIIRTAESRFPGDEEIRELSHYRKYNRAKEGDLKPGDLALNANLFNLDGSPTNLFAYAGCEDDESCQVKRPKTSSSPAPAKPLVVIAGSYSCPPFRQMALAGEIQDMYHRYKNVFQFLTIYIAEAHAVDEWPMGDGFEGSSCVALKQAKTLRERIAAANLIIKDFEYDLPVVVDSMNDEFQKLYAAWPVRYYVIHQGRIMYKAMPTPEHTYPIEHLEEFLASELLPSLATPSA